MTNSIIPMFSIWEMILLTFFDVTPKSTHEIWIKPKAGLEGDLSIYISKYNWWEMLYLMLGIEDLCKPKHQWPIQLWPNI